MPSLVARLAENIRPLLEQPYIRRTRRNHGLEHATVHMLSAKIQGLSAAGRSDGGGFWLIGDIPTEQVEAAAREALRRMRNGEHSLAVHPNCGTSLLTTGTLVSLAAWVSSFGVKRGMVQYLSRLPTVVLLAVVAIIFSRPLGLQLQEHLTTLGDPGEMQITGITRRESRGLRGGTMIIHRVTTTAG
ncbi:MAG TPA: DUF6391 domain-containing protein [Aggregatilineales bacterium]|nr:hypothetical protein [Anaerolineales bacterium]HRE48643.1 DUF6391 domain-containing protein [Aggregatilineales bacterium]